MSDSDISQPQLMPPATGGLLIDAGSQRRKQINRLKRGEGRLTRQLQAAVYQAQGELGIDAAKEIVPVVLLYRRSKSGYHVIVPQA